jgi:CheY-like chemotaxis protein
LIVEDDPDLAQSVADVLDAGGYRTAIAANGEEALGCLRTSELPALILLDMMMPVMDGWTFRAEQTKVPEIAVIPVVVMSADGDPRRKAAAMQAAGAIAKPTTIGRLLQEVERVCGRA